MKKNEKCKYHIIVLSLSKIDFLFCQLISIILLFIYFTELYQVLPKRKQSCEDFPNKG